MPGSSHSAVTRARRLAIVAPQALHGEVLGEEAVQLGEHLRRPGAPDVDPDRVHLVPQLPAEDDGVAGVAVGVPGELPLILAAAGFSGEEVGGVLGRPAVGDQVLGLGGPFLRPFAQVPEVLRAELQTDAVLSGQGQEGVDPLGPLGVELAAAAVLDVEERVGEPDPHEVAAVGGELLEPDLHPGQSAGRRADHVQSDRDVRLPIGELEVSRVARTDADEGRAVVGPGAAGKKEPDRHEERNHENAKGRKHETKAEERSEYLRPFAAFFVVSSFRAFVIIRFVCQSVGASHDCL